MSDFQKYLKDNIKLFDLKSFLNYLSLLGISDFSKILFIPNLTYKSYSTFFEDVFFYSNNASEVIDIFSTENFELILLINLSFPFELIDILIKTRDSDKLFFYQIIMKFSCLLSVFLQKLSLTNYQKSLLQNTSFNYCYFNFFIYNTFYDYRIKVKKSNINNTQVEKNILKLGDYNLKVSNNYKNVSYKIFIYTNSPISERKFIKKYKDILDFIKNHVDFSIYNIITFKENKNKLTLPFKLNYNQNLLF